MVWGALIGAAGGLLASKLSSDSTSSAADVSRASAREQMDFQREQNQKQMDFQTNANQIAMDYARRMSNTAHQREIRDLKLAGLNPILAARYGGSSTPAGVSSGGATSGGAAYAKGVPDYTGVRTAANSAANLAQTWAQTQQTTAQAEVTQREAELAKMDIDLYKEYPELRTAEKIQDISPTAYGVAKLIQLNKVNDIVNTGSATNAKSYGTLTNKYPGARPRDLISEMKYRTKNYDTPGSKLRQIRERKERLRKAFPEQYR